MKTAGRTDKNIIIKVLFVKPIMHHWHLEEIQGSKNELAATYFMLYLLLGQYFYRDPKMYSAFIQKCLAFSILQKAID